MNCSFIKTPEELEILKKPGYALDFFAQERIQAYWLIDEQVYRKLLPPGLEPFDYPLAVAFIAYFARPEYLYPYGEGALFIMAKCNGVLGGYCLAMPVDGDDQALDCGRQFYGYPKKAAICKLERRRSKISAYIERNDIKYFNIDATVGALNDPELGPTFVGQEISKPKSFDTSALLLKYDIDTDIDDKSMEEMSIYDCFKNFRIQQQVNKAKIISREHVHVDSMEFQPSEDDPWIELAPTKILGADYSSYETYMKFSRTLYTYKKEEYDSVFPHISPMWDTWLFGKYHASYKSNNFYR